jgi:hypothetical protein
MPIAALSTGATLWVVVARAATQSKTVSVNCIEDTDAASTSRFDASGKSRQTT